jgi:putative ABC transport system substrate-binding protein
MLGIRRREFITLLGGTAAWPVAARAQQTARMRRIGFLSNGQSVAALSRLDAFKRGLADLGWIEGRNLIIEERWANNNSEKRSQAANLAASQPDMIFVQNSSSLAAIRHATGTIPILFVDVADPVDQGFVSSLSQPGGNITGFAGTEFTVATKNLELLKKISPAITRVVFMYDPGQPAWTGTFAEVESAAPSLGLNVSKTPVRNAREIEQAINAVAEVPNSGLFV